MTMGEIIVRKPVVIVSVKSRMACAVVSPTFTSSPRRLLGYVSLSVERWRTSSRQRFLSWQRISACLHVVSTLLRIASTPSIHLFLGLPTGRFPVGFHFATYFTLLDGPILIECPHHLRMFASMVSTIGSTLNTLLMSTFRFRSLRVTPKIRHRKVRLRT